ncbi:MAG TPA: VOC family protein [Candidatus Limnocylindrales bacterium]|nr:VOC family protein [Candidatus Limnocylindrales bacterium]
MKNATTMISPKEIFSDAPVMSSFAVKDIAATRRFYGDTLGLDVRDGRMGGSLEIHGKAGPPIWIYEKSDHQPAVFTVLNLQVRDVDEAVDALTGAGVKMEHYAGEQGIKTDEKGIARGAPDGGQGPSIAWFKDPSGNIVSVLER